MALLDLLLPNRCPVCGEPGAAPCDDCAADLPPPPSLPPPPGLDACHAVVAYRDGGRAVVAALKFTGARGPLPWVAGELAGRIRVGGLEAVTWIPATAAHRRRRGRDQAEAVARAVAGRLHLPARPFLRRLPGPPQHGRGAAERRVGPPLRVRGRPPGAVLVVDDVITTGGSMAAAARALRATGTTRVVGAAVARTPPFREIRRNHERWRRPLIEVTQGGAADARHL